LNNKFFAETLIRWYTHQHRDLPWRQTQNPYPIWLSEIILQQTRVVQGLPYYERFLEAYPTVTDLANAPEQDVLRLWQGLGYYSRARNLHQTAKHVAYQLNGVFPASHKELLKLKGIGPYTAAAIASFAFDERVAVVDGNVYRVLARIFGIDLDIASTEGQKKFAQLASELISETSPALYNQAIMEFGAVHCTPTSPDCLLCPFQGVCEANLTGRVAQLPVKLKKTKVRVRYFHYFILTKDGQLAMNLRTERDIWQQLYDFYLVETEHPDATLDSLPLPSFLQKAIYQSVVSQPSEKITHILTHQRIQVRFWQVALPSDFYSELPPSLQFFSQEEIDELPKPVLVSTYWKAMFFK
jgi:A/G-specific adenine glycosylase